MPSVLNEPYFHDEAAAFAALEAIVWPTGAVCPHCGGTERNKPLPGVKDKKGRVRLGLWKCYDCRGQFTVRKNTVFESSHIKLHQWFQATYLLCSSKKGVSSHQLARTLGVTVKTAWFVSHRIREAMVAGKLPYPMGEGGKAVESDETFIGRRKGVPKRGGGFGHKMKVHSLVERGGQVRSVVLDSVSRTAVEKIIRENVSPDARLMTDTAQYYVKSGFGTAEHHMVNHYADEYVRGDAHVNTLEGFFSVFKRGMKGIYQHCEEQHLHRYLAEFDFRYNNRSKLGVEDRARTETALRGIVGKRLKYRDSSPASI
jgi:transposase-like protein